MDRLLDGNRVHCFVDEIDISRAAQQREDISTHHSQLSIKGYVRDANLSTVFLPVPHWRPEYQWRGHLFERSWYLAVLQPVLSTQLLDEYWIFYLNQLLINILLVQKQRLVSLVKYHTVLLFLANVTRVLALILVVTEFPFHFVVDFEEAVLPIKVLLRVLIEYQLGNMTAFSCQDESVHIASLIAAVADTVVAAEKAGLGDGFLLTQELHLLREEEVLLFVDGLLRVRHPQRLLHHLDILEPLSIFFLILNTSSYFVNKYLKRHMQITSAKFQVFFCLDSEKVHDFFSNLLIEIEAQVVQVNCKHVFAVLVVDQLVHEF